MEYCTNCGSPLAGTQRYCTKCGAAVGKAAGAVPSVPEAPQGREYPAQEAAPLGFDPPAQAPPVPDPFPQQAPSPGFGFAPEQAPSPGFEPGVAAPPAYYDSAWPEGAAQANAGMFQPTVGVPPAEAQPWPVPPVPPGPPPGRPPRSTPKIIALVAGVVILAAGGGLAAWWFLGHHPGHPAASPGASASGASHGGTGSGLGQSPQASPASPTPSPSQTSPSGPGTLTIAPGVGQQPGAAQVASFVQTYFTAINTHNYGQYVALLQPRLRPTYGQFNSGYRGTKDSNATLTAISPTANGVAASVTFTSHQPPGNSPTHTSCTDWNIILYLQPHGGGYRIVTPPPGYHAQYSAC